MLDGALTLGIGLLTIPFYLVNYFYMSSELEIVASIAMLLPILLRRHSPLLALAGIAIAGIGQFIVSTNMSLSLVAVPIICYSTARWISGKIARFAVLVGLVGSVVGPWRWVIKDAAFISVQQWIWLIMGIMICFGLVITPYAIGRRIRESNEALIQSMRSADQLMEAEIARREHETRMTEGRVRTQIARELHDIVAHSLSVMIVQAEGGKAMAEKHPEAAIAALDTIADTGREAATEMRKILGLLRADPENQQIADYAPAPALNQIQELVSRTSDRAVLTEIGMQPKVSPALQLTIYRLVQEGLTNFLKHAGATAKAEVRIEYGNDQISVEISDNGLGKKAKRTSPGHGLRGMRERVTAMGGKMSAHPDSDGFRVNAVIPFQLNNESELHHG